VRKGAGQSDMESEVNRVEDEEWDDDESEFINRGEFEDEEGEEEEEMVRVDGDNDLSNIDFD